MWLNTEVGLIEGKIIDTAESDYVAKSAARPSDLFIPFIHIMWQQGSWSEICPLIIAISQDFHNMGTSVAKLRHFHEFRKPIGGRGAHRFALTELEYLVTLCRTTFDLLQEMIALIWKNRVRLLTKRRRHFVERTLFPKRFREWSFTKKNECEAPQRLRLNSACPRHWRNNMRVLLHFSRTCAEFETEWYMA